MSKIWITKAELKGLIKEMFESSAALCENCGKLAEACECEESVNPWAVCTASTGNKTGKKRERCIKDIKKQQGQ
jgi:hypothetical protein